MIVVTGATGFLGRAFLRRLADPQARGGQAPSKGPVRAIVRPGRDTSLFADFDLEVAEADLSDVDSLAEAFRGATVVFHLAGEVSIASTGLDRLRQINVEGTRTVIEACRRAKVGRLLYSSSIHAFVEPPLGTCIDETAAIDHRLSVGPYAKSKAEATELVLAAAAEGLDTVAFHPTAIVGPYDLRPSRMGQAVLQSARGKLRAYVDGEYDFVDVRDVVEGALAAWQHGHSGESYILSGHRLTVRELLETVEAVTGVPAPRLRLNYRLARAISRLTPVYYWLTRQEPLFTTYSLDVLRSNCWVSHAKAERELGYTPRSFRETIEDTVAWFRQQGMLPQG